MDKISAVRVRYGLSARYVLCLSSNKPHKNLPALVQAWGLLAHADQARGTQLVIAGHWDARYPEVQNVAVRLGIDAGVRFLPNVAEHDLPALYSGATLFAYPSRYEGFGLPPLEAMACGVPVVCGDASSLPEVVGIAARRVDVCDPMALALGIGQVLKDGDLRAHLAAAGREQAARFSWQRTAARTLRVYEASC
jgi:alpha-1,3-rhamnosyl/mannosyltransferase